MVSGNNGSNLNALIQGLNQLSEQSGALVAGVNQLDDASNTLSDSMGQLADGTSDLADGAGSLADGTANLADGADSLSGYLGQLSDGTGQLSEGTGALIDGIGQLLDGSNDLADGMAEFDEEGIQKLTSLMDGDLTGSWTVWKRFRTTPRSTSPMAEMPGTWTAPPSLSIRPIPSANDKNVRTGSRQTCREPVLHGTWRVAGQGNGALSGVKKPS